ncbi:AMP-binding enzyme [Microdochium trichocladiopsis]|uniref:Very long-chain fatty acid transport protein n=1 Tax=Microdochium trichocladiopsis TaxID=1682393 RepID=A0A9P8XXW1_9PEZI|nr:AMP-binding enzyme [Microdochium trichocladiopsis]KAH7018463.1 AMP-binding enzyme [Microdochium trichocladiopsis]
MAAGALAYLNAKTGFWYDRQLLRGMFAAVRADKVWESSDRYSGFYRLEELATKPSSANAAFLVFQGRTWTYAQAYEQAKRYGNWLKARYDIKPKDIVAMNMMNSDHYVLLTFGLWSIGARPAYINYNLAGPALVHCVSIANSVLMLVDPDVVHNVDDGVREKLPGLRIDVLDQELLDEVAAAPDTRPEHSLRSGDKGRDLAVLIYTSGTTGLPKAAIVGWGKMFMAGVFVAKFLGTKSSDVFYTAMPLYHSSATVMGLAHIMAAEGTLSIGRKFSARTFFKEARETDATIVQYVGETCRYLLTAPPEIDPVTGENMDKKHKVKRALGNGLRPDVWTKFQDRFGIESIAEFYGATEGFIATWNVANNAYSKGAISRNGLLFGLMMWKRIAIIEMDDEANMPLRDPKTGLCRQVGWGKVGELMSVLPEDLEKDFQGYYNNPEATNSKIVRDVLKKGDAYFRTGDLVSWTSSGLMYFQDRIGDTFRWKSENVATTEVSEAMGLHPAVQEANVYGVELPNHDGRAGCVSIVLGEEKPGPALLQSLASHARENLPKYAVPLFLRVSKLGGMITGTNKQQKHDLRMQGVDPAKVGKDEVYWLKGDTYVKFGKRDWDGLTGGQVKL